MITANKDPKWRETSKFLFDIKSPNISDRNTRWALEDIGRNYVKPWIIDNIIITSSAILCSKVKITYYYVYKWLKAIIKFKRNSRVNNWVVFKWFGINKTHI